MTYQKCFWILLILNFTPSMQQILNQQHGSTLTNNIAVASNNKTVPVLDKAHDKINNLNNVPEIIHQIKVQNDQGLVQGLINNVSNVNNKNSDSLKPYNGHNNNLYHTNGLLENVNVNNGVIPANYIRSAIYNEDATGILKDSSHIPSHLLNNSQNGLAFSKDNIEILEDVNATAEDEVIQRIDVKDEQTKVSSTINNVAVNNESNGWIEKVHPELKIHDYKLNLSGGLQTKLSNNSASNSSGLSSIKPREENLINLNNIKTPVGNTSDLLIDSSVVPIIQKPAQYNNRTETISLDNDTNHEISWRSDFPVKEKIKNSITDVNLDSHNVTREMNSLNNNIKSVVSKNNIDIADNNSSDLFTNISINNNTNIDSLNVSSPNLNNNDYLLLNSVSTDDPFEMVEQIKSHTTTQNTILPIHIASSATNSKENPSTHTAILLNEYVNINDKLVQNDTGILNNNTSIINEAVPYVDIAWRSDIRPRKNKNLAKIFTTTEIPTPTVTNIQNNKNSEITVNTIEPSTGLLTRRLNTDVVTKIYNNGTKNEADNVFMIVNSGNIEGFRAILPMAVDDDRQTNDKIFNKNKISDDLNIKNVKSNTSELINNVINSAISNVAANIFRENMSSLISKNLFLILNSGRISNFLINSHVPNDSNNKSQENFNDLNLNRNSKRNTEILKYSNDLKSLNPILDVKFRTGENPDLDSTENQYVLTKPLNNNLNNSSSESSVHVPVTENSLADKDVSSAEAPAFRSLIPQKKIKPVQVRPAASPSNEVNVNDDKNAIKPLLTSQPNLEFDLNNLNIFNNALDLIKRLKRNTNAYSEDTDKLDDDQNKPYKDKRKFSNSDILFKLLKPNRRSSTPYNLPKTRIAIEKTDDLECPLSIFVKLALHQVVEQLSDSNSVLIKNIYPTLISLIESNKYAVNLATQELWNLPFPVKLRLQLLHGDTSDFIAELSKYLDTILCKLS